MKIKYLFSILLASIFFFAGCVEESTDSFNNIKLDKTYLSIPEDGGSAKLTISATEAWEFVTSEDWPENSWLSVDKMSGGAGETVVTFSAERSDAGRELELSIKAGNNLQFLRVRQGSMVAQTATCKDVIAGPDGKTYRVKGVCTAIAETTYGNWYLNDGTGEIYVYGTLDAEGKTKNFLSLGIEVGDSVTVEGPKLTYGSTVELVDVTVVKLVKSLLKVTTESTEVSKEGGELTIKVAYKGNGVFVDATDSWISMIDMTYKKGEPSKLEPNPSDTAVVKFNIAANEAADREGNIKFSSYSGSNSSSVTYKFTQKGSILNVSIDEFIAATSGTLALYRVTGVVSGLSVNEEYQNANLTISIPGAEKELYVYRMGPGEGKKIEELGIKNGDYITVVGKRGEYEGTPQMVNGYYESSISYVSIDEFLAASVSPDVNYFVSGKISNIEEVSSQFKNATLTITDDSGKELYIFRMKAGADKNITDYDFAVGDILYVYGNRSEHNGAPQMGSGICVANVKGEGGSETPAGDKVVFSEEGYENAQDVTEVVAGDAKLTFSQGTGANHPKYYTSGSAVRLYGGGTLTVSSDKTIAKVIFTFDGSNKPTSENSSVDTGSYDVETAVWTGSAKSFVISNTASSGHFRFKSVEVIYE